MAASNVKKSLSDHTAITTKLFKISDNQPGKSSDSVKKQEQCLLYELSSVGGHHSKNSKTKAFRVMPLVLAATAPCHDEQVFQVWC